MKATYIEPLFYNDIPILFIVKGSNTKKYLCVNIEEDEGNTKSLCIMVTDVQIDNIKNKSMDVGKLMRIPPDKKYYILTKIGKFLTIHPIKASDVLLDWIPDDGFFI